MHKTILAATRVYSSCSCPPGRSRRRLAERRADPRRRPRLRDARRNGGKSYKTPVLDKLAATGVRFEHCYVQPLCTPTRVQLMTGMYNVRNYVALRLDRPAAQTTFANLLKTGRLRDLHRRQVAARHGPRSGPRHFGFDEYCLWQHTAPAGPLQESRPRDQRQGERLHARASTAPTSSAITRSISSARKKDEPFFLYYPMMLTHAPYEPTPDSPDYGPRSAEGEQGRRQGQGSTSPTWSPTRTSSSASSSAKLDELGLRDNTLLLFLGDNGTGRGTPSKLGERGVVGGKGTTTDAGMHVPLIANWPGNIAAGKVCPRPGRQHRFPADDLRGGRRRRCRRNEDRRPQLPAAAPRRERQAARLALLLVHPDQGRRRRPSSPRREVQALPRRPVLRRRHRICMRSTLLKVDDLTPKRPPRRRRFRRRSTSTRTLGPRSFRSRNDRCSSEPETKRRGDFAWLQARDDRSRGPIPLLIGVAVLSARQSRRCGPPKPPSGRTSSSFSPTISAGATWVATATAHSRRRTSTGSPGRERCSRSTTSADRSARRAVVRT